MRAKKRKERKKERKDPMGAMFHNVAHPHEKNIHAITSMDCGCVYKIAGEGIHGSTQAGHGYAWSAHRPLRLFAKNSKAMERTFVFRVYCRTVKMHEYV